MYKLLPTEQMKKIAEEYSRRRMSIVITLILLSLMFAIVSLSPSFIIARGQRADALLALSTAENFKHESDRAALEAWAKRARALLATLAPGPATGSPWGYFEKVLAAKPKEVKITGFSFESGSAALVKVRGVAPTRQALLSFQNNLKDTTDWRKVDFPVDALAKDTNVGFELSLTPNN